MKLNEYPSPKEQSVKLAKLTGTEITESELTLPETKGTELKGEIGKKIKYILKYRGLDKKEGTITVIVQPEEGKEKKETKEFDVEINTETMVENVYSYTHKLPILAFKSAIAEIVRGI